MSVSGYQVKLESPDCALRSGMTPYWHIDFVNLISSVNGAKTVNGIVFPRPMPEPGYTGVSYMWTDESGNEVLKHSLSLREKAIPKHCLKKLQAAIDQLHAWAEDPRVPGEKREFCRRFRLPDPKNDPDAYRMTGSCFSRKLHVLWGYQKEGTTAFLPSSKISRSWDDASQRKSVYAVCRGSLIRRLFRIRNIVLALITIGALYFGLYFPVKCPIHGCVVGKGVYNFLCIDERCPSRCVLPNCNRHLDEKRRCHAHRCRECKRMLPTTNGQGGICDECFWEVK